MFFLLGMLSLLFSKFCHGARNPYKVVHDRVGFSVKNFLDQNGPKTGFFEFIEKFGDWFLLNFLYYEILYYLLFSCTNTIFGKILFLGYRPKCSQPIRLQDFLIRYISRINQWNSLIFCMLIQTHCLWAQKLTVSNDFRVSMVKNGWVNLVYETLKSPVSMGWGRGWTSYQIFKKVGFAWYQFFEGGVLKIREKPFFRVGGAGNFHMKNKLKSETVSVK